MATSDKGKKSSPKKAADEEVEKNHLPKAKSNWMMTMMMILMMMKM